MSTLELHNRRTLSDILLATSPIPSLSGLNYDTLKKEKNIEDITSSESIVKISDKVVLNKDFKESTK